MNLKLQTTDSAVQFGKDPIVGEYVVLGEPPRGASRGELPLIFGDNCVIRSHSVVYAGNTIGDNFQLGHHGFLRESNSIGNNVSIGTMSVIEHQVEIQDNVRIHSQAFIPEYTILEDGCWIGPNVVITNAPYPKSERAKDFLSGVRVGKGAKIGANSTILPGIVIGEGALIGAGSVVTKDVPSHTVVKGNPARGDKSVDDLRYPNGDSAYSS